MNTEQMEVHLLLQHPEDLPGMIFEKYVVQELESCTLWALRQSLRHISAKDLC